MKPIIRTTTEKFIYIFKEAVKMEQIGELHHECVHQAIVESFNKSYLTQIYKSIYNGKIQVSTKIYNKFCSILGVRNEFVKKGVGHPFIKFESNVFINLTRHFEVIKSPTLLRIAASQSQYAQGGKWLDPVFKNVLEFVVCGKSMEPVFHEGDILQCRLIEDLSKVKNGTNYVFSIKGYDELMLKQAEVIKKPNGKIEGFKLVSLNKAHKSFPVNSDEIVHIYKVDFLQRKF